jgi:hypothetical protein
MFLGVIVTRYSVVDNVLQEETHLEEVEVEIQEINGERWLRFCTGPESLPVTKLQDAIERGGWSANAGCAPVYVEPCKHPEEAPMCCGPTCQSPRGGWGGRNYDKKFVTAQELRRVLNYLEVLA